MQYPKSNSDFLQTLFGDDWSEIPVSSGASWGVMPATSVDLFMPTMANYYCVSIFNYGGGRFRRKKEIFRRQNIVVLDDIGTKLDQTAVELLYPPPTYKLETSPGNFQWGYKIKGGCDDIRKAEALVEAIIENEMVNPSGKDPGMANVTRVVRLPFGANVKDSVKANNGGKPFPCRLTEWSPETEYTTEELASIFGADLSDAALDGRKVSLTSGEASAEEVDGDFILKLFRSRGMVTDESRSDAGFITVECPWADGHTDPRREAGYRPGLNGFQCHHGGCLNRTMDDLRVWAAEVETAEERVEKAAQAFACEPIEDIANDPELQKAKAKGEEKEAKARAVLDQYVYIKGVERFGDLTNRSLHSRQDFNSFALDLAPAGSSGKNSAYATFLNSGGIIVDDLDYMPGKKPIARTTKNGISLKAFNIWRPGPITPAANVTDADVQEWLDHVAFIFDDVDAKNLFLNFWAYIIQNPGKKINWAFVLRGAQGIGKDLMLRPLLEILGLWNVSTIKARDIESDWTDYLEKQLVIIEELPPYNKKDIYENLKSLVCLAQELVRINKKNVPQYYIKNMQNYFIFTNHEDALALEPDDRRFYVYGSLAKPKEAAYYGRLAKLFATDGFKSALLSWLLKRDLSRFNPMASPPWTDAKREMLAATQAPVDSWIEEQLSEGGQFAGRTLLTTDELMTASKSGGAFGNVPFSVSSRITPKAISLKLKRMGAVALPLIRSATGARFRLWALKSPELMAQLTPKKLAEIYSRELAANSENTESEVF